LGKVVVEALIEADQVVAHPPSNEAFRDLERSLLRSTGNKSRAELMRTCHAVSVTWEAGIVRLVPTSNRGPRGGFVDLDALAMEVASSDLESIGRLARVQLDRA
jgi:hypothetical protein